MSPQEIFTAIFGLFALAMIIGCLITWALAMQRLAHRKPMLPLHERQPVGWGFDGVIVAAGLVILIANAAGFMAQRLGWVDLPADLQAEPMSLADMATLLTIEGISRIVACGLVIAWLVGLYRSNSVDLGFALRWSHFAAGLLGVVALLPPIYLLQAILTHWWVEYEHPVLDLLQKSGNPMYLLPMALIAVVVAPLTEEFLFRVVLQGWLERLGTRRKQADEEDGAEIAVAENDLFPDSVPYWPILVSSLFFALAHFGHGPAPVTLFFLALGLGYLYRQTHSIWPSLLVHFSLNAITMIVAAVMMILGDGS